MAKQKKRYNRIKLALIEKERTNFWLAEMMKVTPATVSRWCTNDAQPSVESLFKISHLLGVDVPDLLNWKKV
jgi:plasmid maintenance system antidote protein VapI